MPEVSFLRKVVILTIFFTCGAFSALLTNLIYSTSTYGFHHVNKKFEKPWFQGWAMFLGMTLLIFDTRFIRGCKCPSYVIGGTVRGWGLFRVVSIPALCDLFATVLQNIAFLYLTPSIWQMMRGSILLFTALFAIFYRHKKLSWVDWFGVVTTIVGITIVGLSSILSETKAVESSTGMKLLAMLLIVIAQALQAFQTIVEEELLHDVDATESEVVSYEGIWGLFFSTFITMPIANILPESVSGIYENSLESFYMLSHSWQLVLLTIAYVVVIVGYNWSGMIVTSFSSAIHRNIYEALRSIAVWALSVIVYYLFPNSGAGEKLKLMSLVQLLGFAISILGSFIYNRVLKFPCYNYEADEAMNQQTNDNNGEYTKIN
ncbi:putative integral membrane protein [Histomonas meleagridis]|uniref:putative integral membrane protein n=1 Tax=Histomonas meleagridis TaxID=135588 RepID=UPI0035598FF7|nr:putative integral membrane protein [Histomonas meleagridis]KAH0805559.1 putative integral membrane protein [Histomonas meleagridis]